MKARHPLMVVIAVVCMVACSQAPEPAEVPQDYMLVEDELVITATPFQPDEARFEEQEETNYDQTPAAYFEEDQSQSLDLTLFFEPNVPGFLRETIETGERIKIIENKESADLAFTWWGDCENPIEAVYVLVAPFPTVRDGVRIGTVESAWAKPQDEFNGKPLLMTFDTYEFFTSVWGQAKEGAIQQVSTGELLETAWGTNQFAIVPFHRLDGRWKVIAIDGKSALDQALDNEELPLSFPYCLLGEVENIDKLSDTPYAITARSNRDLNQLTSVTMTGVTALVRATAHRMETKGIYYPGEIIRDFLMDADFTHISNEVAFADSCPYPNPYQADLRFCSSPDYLQLLEYLDIDIIELTGNHIQDWSRADFVSTLELYEQDGFAYFGGGRTLEEAKEALIIEHNGNKLAFIGCNAVGPYGAWATDTTSGNVPCGDYSWITQEVEKLSAKGYLVIVTLQHNEFYGLIKTGPQMLDFNPLAQAGAVVVSGSQAHYPNPFGFEGNNIIHYGLGNLFFDQMDAYTADGIQREFVDTHYFYDGRYISTEIHTLYLEDFAQPRFMTDEERRLFLEEAFQASGW